jgi:hypothetical protein
MNINDSKDLTALEQERLKMEIERKELELEKMKFEQAKLGAEPIDTNASEESEKEPSANDVWNYYASTVRLFGLFFSPVAIYLVWKYYPSQSIFYKLFLSSFAIFINWLTISIIGGLLGIF